MRDVTMRSGVAIGLFGGVASTGAAAEESGGTILNMVGMSFHYSPGFTVLFSVLLFIGLVLVFHIIYSTRKQLVVPEMLRRQILDDITAGDVEAAQQKAQASASLYGMVVLPGLRLHAHPLERIQQAMEGAGRRTIGALRQEAGYLANIGVLAPMLGLLGTVLGLMGAFAIIGSDTIKEGSRAIAMSPAIAQAMTTTALGLMVGIPAMGIYYLCLSRVGRIADEVEIAAEEVAAALHETQRTIPGEMA